MIRSISTIWNLDDGGSSTNDFANTFFGDPGLHSVVLTVTTQNQCTSSYPRHYSCIQNPCYFDHREETPFALTAAKRLQESLAVPDSTIQWQWTFGNGSTSPKYKIRLVVYSSAGDYNIQLIAANKLGCS